VVPWSGMTCEIVAHMPRVLLFVAWCAVTVAGPAAQAQEAAAHAAFVHDKADQWFVQDALAYGLAHEERLRIIARQAGDAGLVAFATQALPSQVVFNAELKGFLATKDIPPPEAVDAELASVRRALDIPPGAAFDQAARLALGGGHALLIGLLAHEARSGLDSEIRGWAGVVLVAFREQQARAGALR
jgi:hypothetical protein